MINKVVLVGRLTKDPELRYTANGIAVSSFTLAVNRPFANQQGNREADFIACIAWRKQAENIANFMKKGNLVGVDGRMQSRNYVNNEGQKVFVTEVVADSIQFLEPRKSRVSAGVFPENVPPKRQTSTANVPPGQSATSPQKEFPSTEDVKSYDINDDDLPF
ncbi:MAG: single-stranded DNA-binding protein [Bacillus sp. (in: Bacteria)]|nr:single-stranded DNA-binding protein [Bacillus sp. (in: firmicutes)]